eukprot:543956-Prymnesium_polylepis.1
MSCTRPTRRDSRARPRASAAARISIRIVVRHRHRSDAACGMARTNGTETTPVTSINLAHTAPHLDWGYSCTLTNGATGAHGLGVDALVRTVERARNPPSTPHTTRHTSRITRTEADKHARARAPTQYHTPQHTTLHSKAQPQQLSMYTLHPSDHRQLTLHVLAELLPI